MGWASGGLIFDRVAQGLIDGKVSPEVGKPVLVDLIDALTDMDWDTTNESQDEFITYPWIEDAFFEADSDPEVCEAYQPSSWHKGRVKPCEECGWSKRIHDREATSSSAGARDGGA